MLKKIFAIILLTLSVLGAQAQDATLQMKAPNAVTAGEQFSLSFIVNKQGSNLKLPDLSGFDVLMGPSRGSSQRIEIINGNRTSVQEFSFTYILRAKQAGTFNIRPASIEVDGKVIQSNSLRIQVVPAGQRQQQQQQQQQSQQQATTVSDDELFIRLELNKRNVYKGEQIIATVKIYALDGTTVAAFEDVSLPTFEGFYTQDVETPNQIAMEREVHNDKIYQVGVLKKTVLFPQQTGSITIQPFNITIATQQRVRQQRSIFDDFLGSVRTLRTKVTSQPVTVNVRDLPPAPADFYGGVGNFTVSSEISDTEVTTNDGVTLKFNIKGTGNLRLIQSPKLELGSDFEVYEPRAVDNARATAGGVSGTKTVEYLFQPRYEGEYTIPGIRFSYFNPATGTYETASTQEFTIDVQKGVDDRSTGMVRSTRKQDVQLIGQDVRFIWQKAMPLKISGYSFFGSKLFYGIYIIAIIAFVAFVVIYRKRLKENANLIAMRNKKANSIARKHLRAALANLKKNDESAFYESVLKAFWGYMGDKLSIPVADLNRENSIENLQKRNVDQAVIDDFFKIIDQCEFARYAPSGGNQAMQNLYDDAAKAISKMEKQIKK